MIIAKNQHSRIFGDRLFYQNSCSRMAVIIFHFRLNVASVILHKNNSLKLLLPLFSVIIITINKGFFLLIKNYE